MTEGEEIKVWADLLKRKHEWYPSETIPVEILYEGRPCVLLMPDVLVQPERLEIRATVGSGELLVVIGWHTLTIDDYSDESGILMMARRRDESTFAVHVLHELFPNVLKCLGLEADGVE